MVIVFVGIVISDIFLCVGIGVFLMLYLLGKKNIIVFEDEILIGEVIVIFWECFLIFMGDVIDILLLDVFLLEI